MRGACFVGSVWVLAVLSACDCTREPVQLGTWYSNVVTEEDTTTLVFDLGNRTTEVRRRNSVLDYRY